MKNPQPTFDEIRDLPPVTIGQVKEEHIDINGHMNVTCYFEILTSGTIAACGEYGLDLSYQPRQGMGLFAVNHHAGYLRELRLGARYSVHVRLLDATAQGIHTMAYLVDTENRKVATTLESLLLNVNLSTRHVDQFPPSTLDALTAGLERGNGLPWTSSGCGTIRLPRRSMIP